MAANPYEALVEKGNPYEGMTVQAAPSQGVAEPSILGFMAENRARNAKLMEGGWGTGVPKFAYDVGGKVTDLTGSPIAGGVADFLVNAIPSFLSSYRLGPPTSLLERPAKAVMQRVVKPSISDLESGAADKAISTMLQEAIKPTRGGMIEASKRANAAGAQVKEVISNSPAQVNVADVARRLNTPYSLFKNQVAPQSDIQAIRNVAEEFATNPQIAGQSSIPVQLAQKLKQGTYQALGSKSYGEVGTAATEAQKALARGLREEIASAVPEVSEPLAREAALRNVMDVVGPRALMSGNRNLMSLGALRLDDLKSALSFWADRMNWLQGSLAQNIFAAGRPEVYAAPALGGAANVPALVEQLSQRQQPK